MMVYSELNERKHTYVATDVVSMPVLTLKQTGRESLSGTAGQAVTTEAGEQDHSSGTQHTCLINVLIVDDHALIREGLRQLFTLEEQIHVVGEAADGFEAIEKIRSVAPDVVLLDIHLPVVDGIAVTRQITHQFPNVAVIILTVHRQHQQIVDAVRNGARGYLLKNSSAHEVAEAIRVVHQGGTVVSPVLTEAIVSELRRQPEQGTSGHSLAQLSEKELEIVRYLASGLSNREIADRLSYSEKTVKNYLSIIFQKLHLRDRTQVAIFALRQGLLPEEII
jgi:DNA-binding NarL/FixJ family response regulator